MKLILSLLTVLLLQSCGWHASGKGSAAALNRSALYDPPTVTLAAGKVYEFEEGTLTGTLQKFHSDYSYRRAIIIGSSK